MTIAEGRLVREWQHTFYADADIETPLDRVSLGDVWEGESKEEVIYIRNEENAFVRDITYKYDNENLEVRGPKSLYPGEVAPISIVWVPHNDVAGLNVSLQIEGTLVYG